MAVSPTHLPWLSSNPELWRQIAVGAVFMLVGWLLPRPKFVETRAGLAYTATGLVLQRFALGLHGLAILREVWCACTRPGTAAALASACGRFLAGKGWSLTLPPAPRPVKGSRGGARGASPAAAVSAEGGGGAGAGSEIDWYITRSDLDAFHASVEPDGAAAAAADPTCGGRWEAMMPARAFGADGAVTYAAWRRPLPDGKTEYKSVTLARGVSAAEFTDFYLDDRVRPAWDGMIVEHGALEAGPGPAATHRALVVRWLRSFPFSFISDREYVIARRAWPSPGTGTYYTATRALPDHPAAPRRPGVVRMEVFYSVWRCRDVADPAGGPGPACEVTLLHREDFQIPERLARFAVRAGMAGFVAKLPPAVAAFVAARRGRGVGPADPDPAAYGVGAGDGDDSGVASPTAAAAAAGRLSPRAVSFAPAHRDRPARQDRPEAARLHVVASTPAFVSADDEVEDGGGGGGEEGGGEAATTEGGARGAAASAPATPAGLSRTPSAVGALVARALGGGGAAAAAAPPPPSRGLPTTKSAPLLTALLTRVSAGVGLGAPLGSGLGSPVGRGGGGGGEAASDAGVESDDGKGDAAAVPVVAVAAPAPRAASAVAAAARARQPRPPATRGALLRAVVATAVAVALAGGAGGRGGGADHGRRKRRREAGPPPAAGAAGSASHPLAEM